MTPVLDAVRREELRKLAEAATPGPWSSDEHRGASLVLTVEPVGIIMEKTGNKGAQTKARANAAYIAAMSPDTTLALLAYIAELEAGPKMKPLEFVDYPTDRGRMISSTSQRLIREKAEHPFGAYFIEYAEDDGSWWALDGLLGDDLAGSFSEAWEARRAIDADYESRILSALLPKASVREERGRE